MPGTCSQVAQPLLDHLAGTHVPLLYNPEFIALGTVIKDMTNPDLVLVGSDGDIRAVAALQDVYAPLLPEDGKTRVHVLKRTEAEIAKLCVNAFVTMKISFANQLAGICELWDDVNASQIAYVIGTDSRIGRKYLRPGGPYGGPCFPRDNRAFQAFARVVGGMAPLASATDIVNDDVLERIYEFLSGAHLKVAVLGMSYKAGTKVFEESLGTRLLEYLDHAVGCDTPEQAQAVLDECDAAVLCMDDDDWSDLDFSDLQVVIDVWGRLSSSKKIDGPAIIRPGVS